MADHRPTVAREGVFISPSILDYVDGYSFQEKKFKFLLVPVDARGILMQVACHHWLRAESQIERNKDGVCAMSNDRTTHLQRCLDRWHLGDVAAREELFNGTCKRLRRMARKMFQSYAIFQRYEDYEDLLQNASLRLWQTLQRVKLESARHFLNLGGQNIRWELLDLARRCKKLVAMHESHPSHNNSSTSTCPPDGPGDGSHNPVQLAEWDEVHRNIEALPEEYREMFNVLWYGGLKQKEAAAVLGVTEAIVQYRWQQARLALVRALKGDFPE
jgi:RNA polymerase sigma-70 factor (ECF subfamily)